MCGEVQQYHLGGHSGFWSSTGRPATSGRPHSWAHGWVSLSVEQPPLNLSHGFCLPPTNSCIERRQPFSVPRQGNCMASARQFMLIRPQTVSNAVCELKLRTTRASVSSPELACTVGVIGECICFRDADVKPDFDRR